MPRVRVVVLLVALPLLVTACSGDDVGSAGGSTTPTTVDPVTAARSFLEPGPHPVGVATLDLEDGTAVEVWYPAVDGTTGTVAYDARDFVPPAIRAILTGDVPATYEIDGARDADVADGMFPVVLFSHGFTGFRTAVELPHVAPRLMGDDRGRSRPPEPRPVQRARRHGVRRGVGLDR